MLTAAQPRAAAALAAGPAGIYFLAPGTHHVSSLCVQGTLRTALDKGLLKQPGAAYMDPALALLLARDVAAAMLHLHRWVPVSRVVCSCSTSLSCHPDVPHGEPGLRHGNPISSTIVLAAVLCMGLACSQAGYSYVL